MEPIYYNSRIREVLLCNIPVGLIHIDHKKANIVLVGEPIEVLHKGDLGTGGEDIKEPMFFCIRQDRLEFLAAGIAPEFIQ